jgi:hypothetical protein
MNHTDTARETLLKAAELVDIHWCQKAWAIDAEDKPCPSMSPAARRFCAAGAIRRVAPDQATERRAIAIAEEHIDRVFIALENWNDAPGRTAAEVAALLRHAAQAIQEEPRGHQ